METENGAFKNVLKPIKIRNLEIKNRIAMAPMNSGFANSNDGFIKEQDICYYGARAKGGTGLIFTGAVLGTEHSSKWPSGVNPHLYRVDHMQGYLELAETVHVFGGKIFIQLSIGFGKAGHALDGSPPPSASRIPYGMAQGGELVMKSFGQIMGRHPANRPRTEETFNQIPYEMSIEEIRQQQDEYAESAWMAAASGLDGMEIHAPHGYLAYQFLSPLSNQRNDLFGGSLENRQRFTMEMVQKVMKRVRPDFPNFVIGIRLSDEEHLPGGFTFDETKILVKRLVDECGIDYLQMSSGCHKSQKWMVPEKDGTMLDSAAALKKIVNIPIITPSVHDPYMADEAIATGKTDLVSQGRQLLIDPEYANKLMENRPQDIKICTRCCSCLARFAIGFSLRCPFNPNLGREKYMPEYWRPHELSGADMLPPLLRKIPGK